MTSTWRTILLIVPALCAAWQLEGAAAGPVSPSSLVERYCVACHNSNTKAGNLTLDPATALQPGKQPEVWEKVVRRLRARSMPPGGVPRPDEATYSHLVAQLESLLDQAAAKNPNPGRTDAFRRLNRSEYQNAIRDLLELELEATGLLPADDSSHGFDHVTVANLSPTLMERYLNAAQKISRLAVGLPGRSPGGETFQLPADLTQEEHVESLPLGTRGGLAVRYSFPADAEYEIQVRLQRDRNEHVEGLRQAHDLEISIDGVRVGLFTVRPPASPDHSQVDQHLKVRIPVKAGPHTVIAAFPKKASPLLETERQPYAAHFNMDRHPRINPAVFSLTINGPYAVQAPGDTPSRKRIFVCRPASLEEEETCAQRILTTLLRRAWRRPVNEADLRRPFEFFRQGRKSGGFEAGIEMGLRAILVSPEFLFRIERDPPGLKAGEAYRLSDVELASRLSFFLWSSIPDEELLEAASRGLLSQPGALDKQALRLLADARSQALTRNFAGQWLHLRNLASVTPDMRLFPDFDDNLRQAFRKETELFFESIVREDRPVTDLLSARYTYLNERLAKHYGIANVYGSRFRRVELPAGSMRGGLLRHGSILTVTSYATRTSPVIRGSWILANLLGLPPPPPPPGVPALKENTSSLKPLPLRERLAQHRANAACASCHRLMDPIGFALENYDAVGRWRDQEGGRAVDASGSFVDGAPVEGVAGLEKAILARPELFLVAFTEKLLTYALGRGLEYYDAPAVRQVLAEARQQQYRFSSFVRGIIHSTPFQMRRAP
ncbi:MAG: DUF1592 domain-containing protein [Bryobacteraceae bacterium]|nr:DUF1592 domain-containing protein [Bryobacteraceae bacterium]MDW8376679.1 DUF1592 domain-containing protein [Bryobacterales bacterium]